MESVSCNADQHEDRQPKYVGQIDRPSSSDLFFGALALLRNDRYPSWTASLLQEFFVGAYILLAPFIGSFADSRPKGTVMLLANGVKLLGSLGMCVGVKPLLDVRTRGCRS